MRNLSSVVRIGQFSSGAQYTQISAPQVLHCGGVFYLGCTITYLVPHRPLPLVDPRFMHDISLHERSYRLISVSPVGPVAIIREPSAVAIVVAAALSTL